MCGAIVISICLWGLHYFYTFFRGAGGRVYISTFWHHFRCFDLYSPYSPPGFSHAVTPPAAPNQCGTLAELAKKSEFKKSRQKKGGSRKRHGGGVEKKKREVDGYCKLNRLGEGSDFHCDQPE